MRRPVIIDTFCKAGGMAKGYHRAGFDVIGVDKDPQPNFPKGEGFSFVQADFFDLDAAFFARADALHASPMCQGYSDLANMPDAKETPKLIGPVRAVFRMTGKPYIIENVEKARWDMRDPVKLCGSMFGLGAQGHELRRHRLFELHGFSVPAPACAHSATKPVIGVYGGHARRRSATHGGRGTRDVWEGGHRAAMSEAMGIDWMTCEEMSEAIPPAYAQFIGEALIFQLRIEEMSAKARADRNAMGAL